VTLAESSSDPRQPRRFEKEEKHVRPEPSDSIEIEILPARPQHDFDYAVFLVAKLLVHRWRVFKAGRMRDYKTGINLAVFDPLQERLGVGLNMRLSGLDS
jgi:hypothetical protein